MFLDPTVDFVFKRVFGNQAYPEIAMSLLNSLLALSGDKQITSVTFLDTANQQETKDLKHSIVDIRCTDQLKRQFIVEIQVREQEYFPQRIQYYGAQALVRQMKAGDSYHVIVPVILISILNFDMLPFPEYFNSYSLQHDKRHSKELSLVSYLFVELTKFTKVITELQSIEEKWIYFIKHADELNCIPKELAANHEIEEAFELLKLGNLNESELAAYDRAVDARRVEHDVLATAEA